MFPFKGFTAGKYMFQGAQFFHTFRDSAQIGQKRIEHGGNKMHHRDSMLLHGTAYHFRIPFSSRLQKNHFCPHKAPPYNFPDGYVKGICGFLKDCIAGSNGIASLHPFYPVDKSAVMAHYPFGTPRCTGCVDHIGKVFRPCRLRQIAAPALP